MEQLVVGFYGDPSATRRVQVISRCCLLLPLLLFRPSLVVGFSSAIVAHYIVCFFDFPEQLRCQISEVRVLIRVITSRGIQKCAADLLLGCV
jgi:hypothetical protein